MRPNLLVIAVVYLMALSDYGNAAPGRFDIDVAVPPKRTPVNQYKPALDFDGLKNGAPNVDTAWDTLKKQQQQQHPINNNAGTINKGTTQVIQPNRQPNDGVANGSPTGTQRGSSSAENPQGETFTFRDNSQGEVKRPTNQDTNIPGTNLNGARNDRGSAPQLLTKEQAEVQSKFNEVFDTAMGRVGRENPADPLLETQKSAGILTAFQAYQRIISKGVTTSNMDEQMAELYRIMTKSRANIKDGAESDALFAKNLKPEKTYALERQRLDELEKLKDARMKELQSPKGRQSEMKRIEQATNQLSADTKRIKDQQRGSSSSSREELLAWERNQLISDIKRLENANPNLKRWASTAENRIVEASLPTPTPEMKSSMLQQFFGSVKNAFSFGRKGGSKSESFPSSQDSSFRRSWAGSSSLNLAELPKKWRNSV